MYYLVHRYRCAIRRVPTLRLQNVARWVSQIRSEGNSVQKGDTLICTDIRLNKECWFLKEKNGDVMRVIKVQGFQYKNDVMNKQKILRQEKAVTAEIYDLLSQYPVFYITRHFVLNSKKERYITELFSWNDDIKKRIYYKKK